MRAVVQRIKEASVTVDGELKSAVGGGLLVFVGVEKGDGADDAGYIASKIAGLRIFEDDHGRMNLSVKESGGDVLMVSQFTLAGDARKGRRPSFTGAEEPGRARELLGELVEMLVREGVEVKTGEFGAHMEVKLINDGPVTILLDSRKRF